MAQAATIHAIERALDVTRFAMLPIGGAGPVHACAMAAKMNIDRLICPIGAGVASAIGMLAAPVSFEVGHAAPCRLDALDIAGISTLLAEMRAEAEILVTGAGIALEAIAVRTSAMMRYVGQGYEIEVEVAPDRLASSGDDLHAAFSAAYKARYGRAETAVPEILSWRVVASGPRPELGAALGAAMAAEAPSPVAHATRPVFFGDRFIETPVYRRTELRPGQVLQGPAVVEEDESTLVLSPEFVLTVDPVRSLVATRRIDR